MDDHDHIDFLRPKSEIIAPATPVQPPPKKPRVAPWMKLAFFAGAIVITGGFLFSYGIARTTPSDIDDAHTLFGSLRRLITSNDRQTDAAADDRINVLLLGIGGAGHDGAQLTDTMIFGSFKPSTSELGMISIPRDLVVTIPGRGYSKINAVNAYAEQKKNGSGLEATTETVNGMLGQTIDYTIKVDFNGFEKIIDAIGGVDVYVDTSFTDYEYPVNGMEDASCSSASVANSDERTRDENSISSSSEVSSNTDTGSEEGSPYGCRYEVLSFTQGSTHMTGATALKYARSRHGNNGEGSDFARAARQQKILLAVKEKTLSLGVLLNPGKLQQIVSVIQKHISTDMTAWDMLQLAKYIDDISLEKLAMHVIDGSGGLAYSSFIDGLGYVVLPKKDDWSDFQSLAQHIFTPDEQGVTTPTIATTVVPTIAVEIQNGTSQAGLAAQTAQLLASSGYDVITIGNAIDRTVTQTTIYDFTDGQKDSELAMLKDYLNAKVIMTAAGAVRAEDISPDTITETETLTLLKTGEDIDFLIILGENFGKLVFNR